MSGIPLSSGTVSRFGLPQVAAVLRIDDSPPSFTARIFGSWSEYGIYAPASIRGMASNSGLNPSSADWNQSAWSKLTFTQRTLSDYGYYQSRNATLPNIGSAFPVTSSTPVVGSTTTPSAMAGSVGRVVTGSGNITINAGSLGTGRWAVLNAPNAHVTIAGDLTYANGNYSRARDIPQLIIIANNITINSDVTNVDAWLIARPNATGGGALSTCHQRGNAVQLGGLSLGDYRSTTSNTYRLNATHCDRRLEVNGPVVASKLFLRRTAGAESATATSPNRPGNPAEIFNFRPDAYLWAHDRMTTNDIYRTTNIREVPPRY